MDEISKLFDLGFRCNTPNSFENPNEIQKILAAFVSDKSKKGFTRFYRSKLLKKELKKTFQRF